MNDLVALLAVLLPSLYIHNLYNFYICNCDIVLRQFQIQNVSAVFTLEYVYSVAKGSVKKEHFTSALSEGWIIRGVLTQSTEAIAASLTRYFNVQARWLVSGGWPI